jgi:uncharacterized membrane protein YfcA
MDKYGDGSVMTKIATIIAVIGLAVGIFASNHVINGTGKAIFGVFFIVAFVNRMLGALNQERPETTHDHGGLMGKGGHGGGHSHH